MVIVFSHRIRKMEFKGGIIPQGDLQTIIASFKKGIYIPIKGEGLPKASKLIKIYATIATGARRIVYLVDVGSGAACLFGAS